MVQTSLFTVERLSLGLVSFSARFFLWVSFPVFTESGEEQHFLRGKPAFRSFSSLPSPAEQEGGGESVEEVEMLCLQFMFSTRRRVNTGVENLECARERTGVFRIKARTQRQKGWCAAVSHFSPEKIKKKLRKEA